jgi:hypothetical protein
MKRDDGYTDLSSDNILARAVRNRNDLETRREVGAQLRAATVGLVADSEVLAFNVLAELARASWMLMSLWFLPTQVTPLHEATKFMVLEADRSSFPSSRR